MGDLCRSDNQAVQRSTCAARVACRGLRLSICQRSASNEPSGRRYSCACEVSLSTVSRIIAPLSEKPDVYVVCELDLTCILQEVCAQIRGEVGPAFVVSLSNAVLFVFSVRACVHPRGRPYRRRLARHSECSPVLRRRHSTYGTEDSCKVLGSLKPATNRNINHSQCRRLEQVLCMFHPRIQYKLVSCQSGRSAEHLIEVAAAESCCSCHLLQRNLSIDSSVDQLFHSRQLCRC
jgi:hypothetical protein